MKLLASLIVAGSASSAAAFTPAVQMNTVSSTALNARKVRVIICFTKFVLIY